MSVKVYDCGDNFLEIHGRWAEVEVFSNSLKDSDQYVAIKGNFGDKVEVTGKTVHEIVSKVLMDSPDSMKLQIAKWLTHQVNGGSPYDGLGEVK